jgi:Transglutaminase-like superfamily
MLRRRGIDCKIHLGVVSMAPFGADAWVSVRGAVVQGGPVIDIAEPAALQ